MSKTYQGPEGRARLQRRLARIRNVAAQAKWIREMVAQAAVSHEYASAKELAAYEQRLPESA